MQLYNYRYLLYKYSVVQSTRRACSSAKRYFAGPSIINKSVNSNVTLATKGNPCFNSIALHPALDRRSFSVSNDLVDSVTFEKVCDETLESLCDYFEEIVESVSHLEAADVTYGSGVLTVNFGNPYGTYVINRQSPNRQIWLSSPTSGPKRYDFVTDGNYWVYKHDNVPLHRLLQAEIAPIIKQDIDFSRCAYSSPLKE